MSQNTSNDLPLKCHVVIEGYPLGVGLIHRGREGYTLVYDYSLDAQKIGYKVTLERVRRWVDGTNRYMEITKEQEMAMRMGSMRGWDHVGANPGAWEMVKEQGGELVGSAANQGY